MNDTTYPSGEPPEKVSAGRGTAQPRYLQVAHELRAGIAAGTFGEGAHLPTESVLCERYGVSRFTVREALRRLQAEGLIRRRRGSGTTVDSGGPILRQPLSDVDDLLQYAAGSVFDFDVHGVVTLGETQAIDIGLPTGSRWVHLSGIRRLSPDTTPVALSDVFINIELERHVGTLKPGRLSLFEQLGAAAGFRITRIEQDIRAMAAGGREAAALGVARRAPMLRIVRTYRDHNGRIVEVSVTAHPGDRFTYSMHIDPT